MFFDSHIHSNFSFDSKMSASEIMKFNESSNIGVVITDHIDLNLPFIPKINMSLYRSHFEAFRSNSFLLGLEVGLYKENPEEIKKFITSQNSLDFIIGSIHTIQGQDLYYSLKSDNRSKYIIYKEYLETVLYSVQEFNFFDSLGHIDYICRYASFEDNELYLSDFKELLTDIFNCIIEKGKVIELNTNRINNKKSFHSLVEIYSHYKKLGGKYITIGSDAHKKEDLGRNFDLVKEFLLRTKLNPVYFKDRKLVI